MSSTGNLVMMANQIARNLEIQGADKAAIATAAHIKAYWDPYMLRGIAAHLAAGGAGLSPIARDALERVGGGEGRTAA